MIINRLVCKNFKSFADQEFTFGPETDIYGDNYQGKTSIAEGIVYALFGCNLAGSTAAGSVDGLVMQGCKEMEVTVDFEAAGTAHTVIRVKGKSTSIYLDGKKVAQAEIDLLVQDRELFLSAFVPTYFNSLTDKEGRTLMVSLLKAPAKEEVFKSMMPGEAKLLEYENMLDPDALLKSKREQLREAEALVLRKEGQLDEIRNRLTREIPELLKFDDSELNQITAEIEQLTNGKQAQIADLRAKREKLLANYRIEQSRIKQLPDAPYAIGQPCPTCLKEIDESNIDHLLAHHNDLLSNIEQDNEAVQFRLSEIKEEGQQVAAELEALEQSEDDSSNIEHLKLRRHDLEAERERVFTNNGIANRLRMDRTEDEGRLSKITAEVADLAKEKDQLAVEIKAIVNYRSTLATIQIKQLEQHLNRVSIKLFDVTKSTGEVKDVFKILYDGKEYKSLSLSERIRCSLEIANMINKVTGLNYPVFIDNAESITHYDLPITDQIFTSTVVKGTELSVNVAERSAA